ncbi:MAG: flagellar filament capping protein FliD [Oxalobacteraceae bacterium]|nr:flagellar filament capping protein FliD [Oxalobacteraceae bacterium]
MALSSPGVGSGLDVNTLVTQLMTIERAPVTLLDKKEASYQAKLSSYGTLKSSLALLQTAAKTLSTPDKFSPMKASVADTTILSATASTTAVAGSYDVEVQSLAQSQKLMMSAPGGTDGYAATNTLVGEGTITINFGTYTAPVLPATTPTFDINPAKPDAKTIVIGAGNNTLAGIRDAINAANAGVSASIINDGSANGYHLSLTSTDSGARNAMQISVAGDVSTIGDLAQLNYDPSSIDVGDTNLSENVVAKDAIIVVDNVTITKQSNTISDAIQGVTLNLSKTMLGTTTKITLTRDTSNVKSAVESFVKIYNDTNQALRDATAFDTATGKSAVLTGDSTIRSIQSQLRGIFGSPITGAPGGMTILSDVGISFQKDGSLAIDDTKFGAAIADPTKDLSKLFTSTGSIKGYAWQLDVLVGKILSPVGQLVDRTNSVNQSIKDIGTRRDVINARLVAVEQRYRDQFTALDTLIASMTTTSSFLTQQLAALTANNA